MKISKIRHVMLEEGILFSFSGMVSQTLTTAIVESVEAQFESYGNNSTIINTISYFIIEQLQNIMSYSKNNIKDSNKYSSLGTLVIGLDNEKEKYYIRSSNEIQEEDQEKISNKIEHINSLTKEELRKYAREKLRSAADKHARGAGIGFIEMAKKSSEKIEYKFETLNDKVYFHILTYI
jgi:hypothetical protein